MPKQKYTEEYVIEQLTALVKELRENEDIVYIGELFENKPYSRARLNERCTEPLGQDRASRYGHIKEVEDLSATLKEILESRAVTGALKNKLNSTFTIFHMKNNFNWKDKHEVDNKTTLNIENLKDLPTDELVKLL